MAKYGIVKGGVVINVISYDGSSPIVLNTGETLLALGTNKVGINWLYANGTFTAPAAVVTPVVSPAAIAGRLLGIKRITTSGDYVPSSKVKRLIFEVFGGGGGATGISGSNSNDSLSSGGGAGAYLKFSMDLTGLAAGFTIVNTVGAGGGGNTSPGTAGGMSSVYLRYSSGSSDALALAYGGQPGIMAQMLTSLAAARVLGGAGGIGSTMVHATVTPIASKNGDSGADAMKLNNIFYPGAGAGTPFSAGGAAPVAANQAGATGSTPGGGGSGVARLSTSSGTAGGGYGGAGLIIISEYS